MTIKTRGELAVVAAVILASCSSHGPLKTEEVQKIGQAGQAIVLVRFVGEADGKPVTMFHSTYPDSGPGMAIANFETGGEVMDRVFAFHYFSEETLREGWVLLVLRTGIHYMSVQPQRQTDLFTYIAQFNESPRWRIDVPQDARAVYVGTLAVTGKLGSFIGGETFLKTYHLDTVAVRNEEALAAKLFATHMPELGPPLTVLMRRHISGPIIIQTPSANRLPN
jgi:hypothetical protein